jgi:dGTPase
VARATNTSNKNVEYDAVSWHRDLIKPMRYNLGGSSIKDRTIDEEAVSDRARVIYSSAFRRLQHKTQVFTLSKDAAVRSRLTHSLEVANVGRWIAQKVVDGIAGLEPIYGSALVTLVETGCLAHDIGNPPFGHFGESAIQEWFRDKWEDVAGAKSKDPKLQLLVKDFLQFDGNPQGTRILTRLQGRNRDDRMKYGMNLTYSQVLTALKYPRGPQDDTAKWKKAGFFESERSKIESAWTGLGFKVQQRFPYCIGDMEDGIDQGIFTPKEFFDGIDKWIKKQNPSPDLEDLREAARRYRKEMEGPSDAGRDKDCFTNFKTDFTGTMIREAARSYGDGSSEDIRNGKRPELLDKTDANDLLKNLKDIAGRFLYPADKVQRPFLAGLKVTHGILDEYSRFLRLPREQFATVRKAWKSADRGDVSKQQLETLLPLLDALPSHYLDVYDSMKDDPASVSKWGAENWEWFCRAHLIVDYLSGMTDDFAYRTYQVISGARLE